MRINSSELQEGIFAPLSFPPLPAPQAPPLIALSTSSVTSGWPFGKSRPQPCFCSSGFTFWTGQDKGQGRRHLIPARAAGLPAHHSSPGSPPPTFLLLLGTTYPSSPTASGVCRDSVRPGWPQEISQRSPQLSLQLTSGLCVVPQILPDPLEFPPSLPDR